MRLGFFRQETGLPLQRRASDVYAARIGKLSMGQQRRLDLALVLAAKPHVLLLDEPTNHLSIALVDELSDALGVTQAAVVLSAHDRQLLRDVDGWPALRLDVRTES